MKTIEKALVSFLAMDSGAFSFSSDGGFVSDNPIQPDLYSQIN
jgi:hypothetical protein